MEPAAFAALSRIKAQVAFATGRPTPHLLPIDSELVDIYGQVFKDGKELPFEGVESALEAGATVFLKNIGRRWQPISDLLDAVRAGAKAGYAEAALVLSGSTAPGYGRHRDPVAIMALQIVGKKRWTVYEGGATETVAFSAVLSPGDMLWVPKNWWHFVEPLGRGAHLTISLR